RVGEDQCAQTGWTGECVFLCEAAAPRLAEHVVSVGDAQLVDERAQLAHEQVDGPELGSPIGQVGAAAIAELVVEHDDAAVDVVQCGEVREVAVGPTGASVQHHQWRRRSRVNGRYAVHAPPRLDLETGRRLPGKRPFADAHGKFAPR